MWVSLECLGCGLVRLSLDDGVQHYGVVSEAPRTVTILVRPTPPPTSANIFAWSLIDFFHCVHLLFRGLPRVRIRLLPFSYDRGWSEIRHQKFLHVFVRLPRLFRIGTMRLRQLHRVGNLAAIRPNYGLCQVCPSCHPHAAWLLRPRLALVDCSATWEVV